MAKAQTITCHFAVRCCLFSLRSDYNWVQWHKLQWVCVMCRSWRSTSCSAAQLQAHCGSCCEREQLWAANKWQTGASGSARWWHGSEQTDAVRKYRLVGSAFAAVSKKLKYCYNNSFRCFASFAAALPTSLNLLCQTLTCFAHDRHELQPAEFACCRTTVTIGFIHFPIAIRSVCVPRHTCKIGQCTESYIGMFNVGQICDVGQISDGAFLVL